MDVEVAIRYSDVQLCTITLAKPNGGEALYQIVTKTGGISQSLAEAFRETRRLFACEPWPDR